MNLMARQTLFVQLFHEGIWIEFLYVVYARLLPQTLAEHHGAYHGWYACGVADALHARFLVGSTMRAVVVNIVGVLHAIIAYTTNATAN